LSPTPPFQHFARAAGIGGVFKTAQDTFDPARHVIRGNSYTSVLLEQKLAAARVTKINQLCPLPGPKGAAPFAKR